MRTFLPRHGLTYIMTRGLYGASIRRRTPKISHSRLRRPPQVQVRSLSCCVMRLLGSTAMVGFNPELGILMVMMVVLHLKHSLKSLVCMEPLLQPQEHQSLLLRLQSIRQETLYSRIPMELTNSQR